MVGLKAYIRSQIISYSSNIKKQKAAKLKELSRSILMLDEQYALSPNPDILYIRKDYVFFLILLVLVFLRMPGQPIFARLIF